MTGVPMPESLDGPRGCRIITGDGRVHPGGQQDDRAATKAHPGLMVDTLDADSVLLQAVGVAAVDDEPLDGFDRICVFDPFGPRIEPIERAPER